MVSPPEERMIWGENTRITYGPIESGGNGVTKATKWKSRLVEGFTARYNH